MRAAIIDRLRRGGTKAGGRVYQAFLAPAKAIALPYVTVKMATRIGDARGLQPVECYLYTNLTSFTVLDTLEQEIIRLLHQREFTDTETGLRYRLSYASSAGDAVDNDNKLINRVVTFNAASVVIVS